MATSDTRVVPSESHIAESHIAESHGASSRSPRRWIFSSLAVAAVSLALVLLSGGSASAADGGSQYAAAPATTLLGVPVGTLVWAVLGLVGLVVGISTVGRSRGAGQPSLVQDQVKSI